MPLHLLGKKSWNVYNADNVARVRRDEAEAQAKEEAEEQRMQEEDAKRRLAILRGEILHPIEEPLSAKSDDKLPINAEARPHKEPKVRKLAGEDITEFELRIAKNQLSKNTALQVAKASSSAPLIGRDGHIDLIGDEKARRHVEKNEEAEREAAKKKMEYKDQFTMRLANAVGKNGVKDPWYTAAGEPSTKLEPPGKDVWGNEDPRRRERDSKRLTTNDPLAMMKSGAARVREVNKARAAVQREREEELRKLRKEERRREKSHRRGEEDRKRPGEGERRSGHSERHDYRHRRRRRSSSPDRDRRRGEDRRRH